MLKAVLDSHPDIICLPAIFTPSGWPDWRSYARQWPDEETFSRMATLPEKWDDFDSRTAEIPAVHSAIENLFGDKMLVGFKHHVGPVDRAATAQIIALGLRSIILTRRNALAAFSSGKIAAATGQGFLIAGRKKRDAKIVFDAREFGLFIQWWRPSIHIGSGRFAQAAFRIC